MCLGPEPGSIAPEKEPLISVTWRMRRATVSLCSRSFCHDALPRLRPRAMESANHGRNLRNHEPQINFSSSKLFLSYILVTAKKKKTNTIPFPSNH
ncbi:Hypothetical predicted protein [Marmota monax]|nr:Hypothetical predicted protein [Marmota monax]